MTGAAMPSEADDVFDATGIAARALRAGAQAPDVTLPDATGKPVRLADAWRRGPLVVVFYRGGWCTYCNLQLRAWRQQADALARLGATLLAISPQTPEHSARTVEDHALGFTVLSDCALEAANGFGLAYTLHPDVVDYYGSVGTDIPVLNGNGQWVLPVPATYVIDSAGAIRLAWVEEDVRERAQPRDVIAAVESLHDRS
jgi:peroxiredoxin